MTQTPILSFRRRTYFIKKGLQTRFALGFSLAVFLGLALNMLLVYFLIDRELSEELYKIHIKIRTTSEIAVPVLWKLGAITVPAILIVSALVGYYLTRRIEMPLLTFKEAVRKTAQGDFTPNLSKDIQTELPEVFNKMERSLGSAFGSLRKSADVLSERFDRFKDLMHQKARPSKEELAHALHDIAGSREDISREVSRFRV